MAPSHKEKRELEEHLQRQAAAAEAGAENTMPGHDVPLYAPGLDMTTDEDDVPPPAYGNEIGTIHQERDGFGTRASVTNDGRVNISIDQRDKKLSKLLSLTLNKQLDSFVEDEQGLPPPYIPPSLGGEEGVAPPPPMNVVIQVVGSRGDVQPFVALAKVLKDRYGHRVRLATHPTFEDFVWENGIEFFSIGGDPQGLMAFMVKNPGLMPGFDSLRAGDVGKRRTEIAEYLEGCWRSCFETGDGLGSPATDETVDDRSSQQSSDEGSWQMPFVADCIIANPPSFAHAHLAEKLGIPLHIYFTMPYSPTQAFPHPLANIQASNADENFTNYISYGLVDMLTWQGLGDIINRFRKKSLGLDEISSMRAPGMLQRLKIPHTYAWSPAMIPKPRDWGASISIAGFFFLDLAKNYTPAPDLKAFLDAGPPPVYIGFGSIVLDDPNGMTQLIFEALRKSGQRALVSKGWGGVGADQLGKPDNVFMLGNVPHDWLFQHVSCVVHHGGAGTTSAGITAGRPTLVVPFFGDQPFWGAMVARAGAGPEPIHSKSLTSDKLADAILKCLQPEMQQRAHELARKMAKENGSEVGAQNFHQFLDVENLRCSVAPSRVAVWVHKRTQARLSAMAACTLAQEGLLNLHDLKVFRPREYEIDEGPWDPLSGGAAAVIGTFSAMVLGVADLPGETMKIFKSRPQAKTTRATRAAESKTREDSGDFGVSATYKAASRQSMDANSLHSSSPSRAFIGGMTDQKTSELASEPSIRTNSTFSVPDVDTLSPGSGGSDPKGMSPSANVPDGQLGRQESRSGSRQENPTKGSGSDIGRMFKAAVGHGKGMNRIVGAGLKSPMEFSVNMTKGFHNVPKLYGDDTVRKSEKVSGFRSGLTAAGKEFGYGMFDGVTGLVTQPMKGAAKEGGMGFLKGFGKGIGGFVCKPGAALFAVPGYTMKGVYKEMQKHSSSSVQSYVIAARTAQGLDEYQRASPEERRDVVMRWKLLRDDLKREPKKNRNSDGPIRSFPDDRMQKEEAKSQHGGAWPAAKQTNEKNFRNADPESAMLAIGSVQESALGGADRRLSPQTSYGNPAANTPEQQSMQPHVAEVQKGRTLSIDELEDEQLRRAIAESAADARRHQNRRDIYDKEVQGVLTESLSNERGRTDYQGDDRDVAWNQTLSGAIPTSAQQPFSHDPKHLSGITREDFERQRSEQQGEKSGQEKAEEQVVLDYTKKQSLLEEQHRNRTFASRPPMAGINDEDDKDLQLALKLSMQGHG